MKTNKAYYCCTETVIFKPAIYWCSPMKLGNTMNQLFSFLLCAFISLSACTSEINSVPVPPKQIPHNVKITGNIVAASKWSDKTGDNLVVLSTIHDFNSEGEKVEDLYVSAFRKRGEAWTPTWDLWDFVEPCNEDVVCDFVKGSLEITDLDHNGIAEVSFVYRLACVGDMSDWKQKLFLVEQGKKYPLRGWIESEYDENGVRKDSSQMKIDKAFNSAPSSFQQYAVSKWNRFMSKALPNY